MISQWFITINKTSANNDIKTPVYAIIIKTIAMKDSSDIKIHLSLYL